MIARGPAGGNYSFVMIGDQAMPLIAAAYNKGIRDFDVEAAYAGAVKNAFVGGIRDHAGYEFGANPTGGGMQYYVERGWIRVAARHARVPSRGRRADAGVRLPGLVPGAVREGAGQAGGLRAVLEARRRTGRTCSTRASAGSGRRTTDGTWLEPFTPTCKAGRARDSWSRTRPSTPTSCRTTCPAWSQAIGGPDEVRRRS